MAKRCPCQLLVIIEKIKFFLETQFNKDYKFYHFYLPLDNKYAFQLWYEKPEYTHGIMVYPWEWFASIKIENSKMVVFEYILEVDQDLDKYMGEVIAQIQEQLGKGIKIQRG